MKIHDLKCEPIPFFAVFEEKKRAEFRRNDRGFAVGDHIVLKEFKNGQYTRLELMLEITHIQTGFGIPDGFAMLSFQVKW